MVWSTTTRTGPFVVIACWTRTVASLPDDHDKWQRVDGSRLCGYNQSFCSKNGRINISMSCLSSQSDSRSSCKSSNLMRWCVRWESGCIREQPSERNPVTMKVENATSLMKMLHFPSSTLTRQKVPGHNDNEPSRKAQPRKIALSKTFPRTKRPPE